MKDMEIILNGKILAIDTKNLDGYFTFNEAKKAAKSSGKRLMTKDELESLCKCENWWDRKRKGRIFRVPSREEGHIDLFFPAAGYRYMDGTLYSVGQYGYYWSSSPNGTYGYSLYFYSTGVNPANYGNRQFGFSVRLVKDVK